MLTAFWRVETYEVLVDVCIARRIAQRFTGCMQNPDQLSAYRDRRFLGSQDEFETALRTSTTVYVGNLSFYTTEEQIYEVFSRTGELKKITMGLDKNTKTPCGFCFVLYVSTPLTLLEISAGHSIFVIGRVV
jgi:hypothetical protein